MRLPLRGELQAYMDEHGVSEDAAKIALWPEDLAVENEAYRHYHAHNVTYEEAREVVKIGTAEEVAMLRLKVELAEALAEAEEDVRKAEDEVQWAKDDLDRALSYFEEINVELLSLLRKLNRKGV